MLLHFSSSASEAPLPRPLHLAFLLWCTGLATVTFDRLGTFEAAGFTIKSYYFLFLAAALLTVASAGRAFFAFVPSALKQGLGFALLLALYQALLAPFSFYPLKSAVYTAWLIFDIVCVLLVGSFLLQAFQRQGSLLRVAHFLVAAALGLSAVVLVDHVAYHYGYGKGLIGFNQDELLKWGVSRPHAFAYEPSYLGLYFSLLMPILAAYLMGAHPKTRWMIFLCLAAFAASTLCLLAIGSRLGLAAALLTLGLAVLLSLRHLSPKPVLGLAAAVVAGALLTYAVSPPKQIQLVRENFVDTVVQGKDGSGNARVRAMQKSLGIAKESHLLGVGVGASYAYEMAREGRAGQLDSGAESIMSIWGQLLAESGLAGPLCFLALGLSLAVALYRRSAGGRNILFSMLFASCVIFFIFSAHWVGNVARTDIWVWIALWHAFGHGTAATDTNQSA